MKDYIYLNLIKQGLPWTSDELTKSMMVDGKNIKIYYSNIVLLSSLYSAVEAGLVYRPDMLWIHPDLGTSDKFLFSPDILLLRELNHSKNGRK